jgi:hypothetical protein
MRFSYLDSRIDNAKIDLQNEMKRYIIENIFREVTTEDEINKLIIELEDLSSDMLREKLSDEFAEIVSIAVPVRESDVTMSWSEKFSQLSQNLEEHCSGNITNLTKKIAIFYLIEEELENSFESLFNGVEWIISEKLNDLETELNEIWYERKRREREKKRNAL